MLKQREVETKRVENKRVERLFFSPDQNTSVRLHSKIKKQSNFIVKKKYKKQGEERNKKNSKNQNTDRLPNNHAQDQQEWLLLKHWRLYYFD